MEYIVLIVVIIAMVLQGDRVRGRKKVPPPTVPQDIPQPPTHTQGVPFEIPPMHGIPEDVQASTVMQRTEQLRERYDPMRRQMQRAKQTEQVPLSQAEPRIAAGLLPPLTPDRMQRAVVLAEVLNRPRALRRFPRR